MAAVGLNLQTQALGLTPLLITHSFHKTKGSDTSLSELSSISEDLEVKFGSWPDRVWEAIDSPNGLLALYFAANLGLTLYNKLVLVGFPFPWTLTALHAFCGSIGAKIARDNGAFEQHALSQREHYLLLAFSVLYTVNIAVSNLSLQAVTVPIHQVVRSITPLITIAISVAVYHKSYSRRTYLSLVVLVGGIALATYGDYYCTVGGLLLTLLGACLAAVKGIVTNMMQVGKLKLHPLDLLLRMSPLACAQCVVAAWWTGEFRGLHSFAETTLRPQDIVALFGNGALAFMLNVVSFAANKKSGALTMTVAANVKQVITVLLATVVFHLKTTPAECLGIALTLGGGALYAQADLRKQRAAKRPSAGLTAVSVHTPTVEKFERD